MKKTLMTTEMQLERAKLAKEKEELLKKLEILTSNISLLDKFCGNGRGEPTPRLKDAPPKVMEAMRRFTLRELSEQIKQRYPGIEFSDKSVAKPVKEAVKRGQAKLVQPNLGSKTQAVYEWAAD